MADYELIVEVEAAEAIAAEIMAAASKLPGTPAGASISQFERRRRDGFVAGPEIITFVISFASGVGSSIVATWLFEKLKGRRCRLTVNRRVVEIEEGSIRKVIEEFMEEER